MSEVGDGRKKKQPKPIRHVRIQDETWVPAAERAESELGITISELTRLLLDDYRRNGLRF